MKKQKESRPSRTTALGMRGRRGRQKVVVPSNYIRLLRVQLFIFSWWVYSFARTSAMPARDTSHCLSIYYFTFSPSRSRSRSRPLPLCAQKGRRKRDEAKEMMIFFSVCISFLSFLCAFVYPPLVNTHRKIRISHCSSERSPTSIDSFFLLSLSLSRFFPLGFVPFFSIDITFPSFLSYQAMADIY